MDYSKSDKTISTRNAAPQVISVTAPAKINLYFDILNKRADHYHEIVTLFQAVDLQDTLTFNFNTENYLPKSSNIEINLLNKDTSIEEALFPIDQNNSISKAIEIFLSAMPNKPTVTIKVQIEKNIPIGAGLAGGSTDAAATLLALNHYFGQPFTNNKLLELAAQLGSDISFCLLGGLAIGRGRGEQLESLTQHSPYHFILVKPRKISVSTPWAYKMYDEFIQSSTIKTDSHAISDLLLAIKFESDLEKHAKHFYNTFENVIFKEHTLLVEIKSRLLKLGCLTAHLSGSGPTIYGLVKTEEAGKQILKNFQSSFSEQERNQLMLDTWLTKSIDRGVHIKETNDDR